jgi:hypothetical protein
MQPPRVTFKLKYLLAFVAVVAIGLSLDSQRVAIWDGAFPLQLDLQDATGHAFVAVATKTLARRQEAEYFLAHPDSPELDLEEVPRIMGQAITIQVPCWGRTSLSGRELNYGQFSTLLVRVEYSDSTRRMLAVAIPDGRLQRRTTVPVK